MEPLCDFCGIVRAFVYCKSDAARLCLQCDNCVHSANALSCRHPRSPLCDKCNVQPAVASCLFDKMYLCQGCELNGNGCSSGQGHSCQKLDSYTGCPSIEQLANFWSTSLGQGPLSPSSLPVNPQFSPMSSLSISEKSVGDCLDVDQGHEGQLGLVASKLNELATSVKFDPWLTNSSSVIPPNLSYIPSCKKDQTQFIPEGSNLTKDDPNLNKLRLNEGEDLCGGVSLDDVALSFNAGYEMFGCTTQDQTKYRCEDGDLDCLVLEKNLSVTESNSHMENAFEATSSVKQDCITFQPSQVGGSANLMQAMSTSNCMLLKPSCNRSTIGLGFPTGQVHSSMSVSLSNITGESSAADYQDCGLSPMFLTGESPWESNFESTPQARDKAKMRYNEKKKTRTFGKQIRYASRKARADTRKRVKGRFVKAGEAYDYDPVTTRDF